MACTEQFTDSTDRQTGRQTDRLTGRHVEGRSKCLTHGWTDELTNILTERCTEKQTNNHRIMNKGIFNEYYFSLHMYSFANLH